MDNDISCIRRSFFFHAVLISLLFSGALLWWNVALAAPQGGEVVAGGASILQNGNTTQITQTTAKAIINWSSFNTSAAEQVNFSQPNSSAIALNRITSGLPTMFSGLLTANGQVWIVNPAGVFFTGTSKVDVSGLLVSTLDISNQNFMNGVYEFNQVPGFSNGAIVNDGEIVARGDSFGENGLVALVAPGVENNGVIRASLGKVALASGTAFTLDLYGDQLINFATDSQVKEVAVSADGRVLKDGVSNNGLIEATGGQVLLTANTAAKVVENVVSMNGVIEAKTATEGKNGVIILGGSEGNVSVSGRINVSAEKKGNGGKIIVKGDKTKITGELLAKGGSESGDGGYVETSGNYLDVNQMTLDVSAPNGKGGTWLIDPYNIEVVAGNGLTNNDGGTTFTPNGDSSQIGADLINAQLDAGTDVILDTTGAGVQAGDITISSAITKSANVTSSLILDADNDVIINAPIDLSVGTSSFSITALGGVEFNAAVDVANDLSVNAGGAITQTSPLTIGGISSITTGAAPITLTNAGNDFVGEVTLTNTGANDVSITDVNTLTLGASSIGNDLTVESTTTRLSGNTTAGGTITFLSPVELDTDITLTATLVDFDPPIDGGGFDLTIMGNAIFDAIDNVDDLLVTGNAVFNGQVGSVTPLSTVHIQGTSDINTSLIKTLLTQIYDGAVTLLVDTDITGSMSTFNQTIDGTTDGEEGLTINGDAIFNDLVGDTVPLEYFIMNGNSTFSNDAARVTTEGDQTYNGEITLMRSLTLDAGSAGDISFNDTVNGGAYTLTIANANDVNGNGAINVGNFNQSTGTGLSQFIGGLTALNNIIINTNFIAGGIFVGNIVALTGATGVNGKVTANQLFLGGASGGDISTVSTVGGNVGKAAADASRMIAGIVNGPFYVNGYLVTGVGDLANALNGDSPNVCVGGNCGLAGVIAQNNLKIAAGTIFCMMGFATAIDKSGNERILLPGDTVYMDEKVITDEASSVTIQYSSGESKTIRSSEEYTVGDDEEGS